MYFEAVADAINEEKVESEGMDDIIMTIARVRRDFNTDSPHGEPEPKLSQ
jgi:hypothetical protein